MISTCQVEGCGRPAHARKLCPKHYRRLWKGGGVRVRSAVDRFWSHVNKDGPVPEHAPHLGECWVWTGATSSLGYGYFFRVHDRHTSAHRFSYEIHHGEIPSGHYVMHMCDNPPCVRPEHLRTGDPAENVADMLAKGRASHQRVVLDR